MKRKSLSYQAWSCITRKNQQIRQIHVQTFSGYISLIQIQEVSEPQIWNFKGEEIIVCQEGYQWLSILPADGSYCITAMFNQHRQIVLWYIDMIAAQGTDTEGIPWFDDLYLDLIVRPDGTILEDDRDELEEALRQGDITWQQFELADRTCRNLKEGLLSDLESFQSFTYQCKSFIIE